MFGLLVDSLKFDFLLGIVQCYIPLHTLVHTLGYENGGVEQPAEYIVVCV